VGTLKWIDSNGSEELAEKDDKKASALQEFFSIVYTVEKDVNFNNLPPMLADSCSQMSRLVSTKDDVDKKLIQRSHQALISFILEYYMKHIVL